VAGLAEVGVGGRDGRAAEPELARELAFRGKAGAEGDPPVEDQQPDAIGERRVRGALGEVAPAGDEEGQGTSREGCHPATVAELAP